MTFRTTTCMETLKNNHDFFLYNGHKRKPVSSTWKFLYCYHTGLLRPFCMESLLYIVLDTDNLIVSTWKFYSMLFTVVKQENWEPGIWKSAVLLNLKGGRTSELTNVMFPMFPMVKSIFKHIEESYSIFKETYNYSHSIPNAMQMYTISMF